MRNVASVTRTGWRRGDPLDALVTREWLVTNALGGYACGTLAGVLTRRFHGMLVASLGAPRGRTMVMNALSSEVVLAGGVSLPLDGSEVVGATRQLPEALAEVRFESGLPIWRYEMPGLVLERRVMMPHERNTTLVTWRLLASAAPVRLRVSPALHVRPHEGSLAADPRAQYPTRVGEGRWDLDAGDGAPPITLRFAGTEVRSLLAPSVTSELLYADERSRGYDDRGALFTPGSFEAELAPNDELTVVVTVDDDDRSAAVTPAETYARELERRDALLGAADVRARQGMGAELVLAADAFVIRPALRDGEARVGAHTRRTIIAGYHWFTDWGRDTMISLEGLTLLTGRREEAACILRTFARHVKDGLIPNMFPEGQSKGLYHTADATLWFFHALDRYVEATGDRDTLRELLPTMLSIAEHHVKGTRFGIGVDARDDLLSQGADGYQLTWMDAKVGDWVVTPRRGKPVEINALWFNALRLLAQWLTDEQRADEATPIFARAERVQASFNRRFWCEARGHLRDVVDGPKGDDDSLRPNQIFAVSLPNPVLAVERWERVVDVVRDSLLTPRGLRSLAPGEPEFKPRYDGDLHARDAAYHQGTVWGWLVGPFVDAWLRVHVGDVTGARRIVEELAPHLGEAGVGQISEIFDAEPPYTPRGCVAQAWSVAEALRAWVRTAPIAPPSG